MSFDIVILILFMSLKGINSQKDNFQSFREDIKTENFTDRFKREDMGKITSFIKFFQSNREKNRLKDPSAYCRNFVTCQECVKSFWYICGWCHNIGCIGNPEQLCPYTKRNSNVTASCPHISNKGPLLIPAGVRKHIKVELTAPDPVLYNAEIICQLNFNNKLTHLKGMVLNDLVYCYPVTLSTDEYPDTKTGTLSLIWGGAQPFSNDIPITVYRCETLALDCDGCRMLPPEYGCGWCDERNNCVLGEKCADQIIQWTVNRLKCDVHGKKLYYV